MTRILDGVRVLDIGRYVAGPYAATLLSYFGADVVRVERREGGEDRYIAPLFEDEAGNPGEGGLFFQTACGKKSVTLDLSKPAGRYILRSLMLESDIVVANLPPSALKKLGLDWETFSADHPRGILVTQSSFGTRGPDRDKGGFDGVAQAMSGAMYLTGTPDHPVKAGAPYADFCTAVFSALGAMAAFMQREKTGRGDLVETSLLGTALAAMNSHLAEQAVTQKNRVGTGNRVQTSAPSDVFRTRDGHVLVHTVGDNLFKRWAVNLVGRSDLADDPALKGDQARGDQRDTLCEIMATWCQDHTTVEALTALETAGIPSGPVLSMQGALDNPQATAMEMFKMIDFPGLPRPVPAADLPINFAQLQAGLSGRPPRLGEHTDEVLKDLGFDDAALQQFRDDGVI